MAWRPIAGSPPQISASDNTLASGYYLKFYASGTTTPINMATDSTGGTTLAKCQINASGYPINGSSAVFIPYIDQKYRLVLYTNATDADANTFGNADWDLDAIDYAADIRDELANTSNASQGDALIGVLRTYTDADATTLHSWLEYKPISLRSEITLNADGTTDDTANFTAAYTACNELKSSGNTGIWGSTLTKSTQPEIHIGYGIYSIQSAITTDTAAFMTGQKWVGHGAALTIDTGITAFGGVGYGVTFEDITFIDGATAISIKTNNSDTSVINVNECEFHDQETASIEIDNNSASTLLNINQSKFYNYTGGGKVLDIQSGDRVNLNNTWISCSSTVAIENRGVLQMENCLLVPWAALTRWVDNYGITVIRDTRLGGEDGGSTPIRNYGVLDSTGDISAIIKCSLIDCRIGAAGEYVMEFYELPNIIEIRGCYGTINTLGLYFDSALTSADFVAFQQFGQVWIENNESTVTREDMALNYNNATAGRIASRVIQCIRVKSGNLPMPQLDRITEADIAGSVDYGDVTWSFVSSTNSSEGASADSYGVTRQKYTATADDCSLQRASAAFLDYTALTYGAIYTINVVVDVEADHAKFNLRCGGAVHDYYLARGRHVVALPFVYLNDTAGASATYDQLDYFVYLDQLGDDLYVGRFVLIEGLGKINPQLKIEGTAAPTGYTSKIVADSGYFVGDMNYRANVAAAGSWGDFCTTEGNPGTWKASAVIAA